MTEFERDKDRENRELRRYLRELIGIIRSTIGDLNDAMKGPSTEQRGQKIAQLANRLDMAAQIAERFGLTKAKKS